MIGEVSRIPKSAVTSQHHPTDHKDDHDVHDGIESQESNESHESNESRESNESHESNESSSFIDSDQDGLSDDVEIYLGLVCT